jgi:hypothetical protein
MLYVTSRNPFGNVAQVGTGPSSSVERIFLLFCLHKICTTKLIPQ